MTSVSLESTMTSSLVVGGYGTVGAAEREEVMRTLYGTTEEGERARAWARQMRRSESSWQRRPKSAVAMANRDGSDAVVVQNKHV